MIVTLKNDLLTVQIDSRGAELLSIKNNRTGYEYLWQGDSSYWGRRSPVLFPIVGALWNGAYTMDGRIYPLGQHGFARDSDFDLLEDRNEEEAWFVLCSTDDTLKMYPRSFRLEVGYVLSGERLMVKWHVLNTGDREICFQIGAHPGFNYPDFSTADQVHGYLNLDCREFVSEIISAKGCVGDETIAYSTDADCMLPLTASLFDRDALIVGDDQIKRVSLLDKMRRPFLTLFFRSPAVGIWSPPKKDAPFVCIEPWWGRCDRVGFNGEFCEREYVNRLEPDKQFDAGYMIIIDNV